MKLNNTFFIAFTLITAGLSTHNSSTMVAPHRMTPLEKKFERAVEGGETERVKTFIKTSSQLRNKLAADQNYANYWLDLAARSADNILFNVVWEIEKEENKLKKELKEEEEELKMGEISKIADKIEALKKDKYEWLSKYSDCLETAYLLIKAGADLRSLNEEYQKIMRKLIKSRKKLASMENKS